MPPGKEKGLVGVAGGDTQVNPSGLVGNETSAATVQTVAPFVERDEGFDGKSPTDHATVGGGGVVDAFAAGLKAGLDTEKGEPPDPGVGKEPAVGEDLLGQASEGGFEPAKGGEDQRGI